MVTPHGVTLSKFLIPNKEYSDNNFMEYSDNSFMEYSDNTVLWNT